MSTQETVQRTCQIHENIEIIAVDLTQSQREQQANKYLCVKCLIDKIGINTIVLYDNTIDMIKEMKSKAKEITQNMTQVRVNNIKQLQQSILDFDQLTKEVIGKLQNNINQKIIEGEKEIELRDQQMDSINLEEDIPILSSLYQGNNQFEIPNQSYNSETISQFLDSLEQSLHQISISQQISSIYSSIKKIKQQFSIQQEFGKIDKNRTPSLKQICKIHEQEIIMVDISECESEQQNRFACVECVQQFPNKYVSLKEANKRWCQYKEQQQEMNSSFKNQRQSKFNLGIQIVSEFQQSFKNQINEIIQSLETQFKLDQQIILIKNDQKNLNIDELDEQEILKVLNILSQKDQHLNQKKQLEKLNQDDSIYYCNLKQNLDNLVQLNILTKYNLIKVFIDNQQELLTINDIDSIDSTQIQLDEQSIIKKFKLLEYIIQIINDSFNFYKNLQKEINEVKLSELLEQSQTLQKEYQSFQSNSNLMQILTLAEDNLKQSKVIQEENQKQQSQLQGQGKLITEQSEKLKQLNQELTQTKRNELELTNQKKQNTDQIDSLTIKLKEQEQQYQQLQDSLQKKTKELNQQIQNIQSNLTQTNLQLKSKDQELKNHQVQHEALLKELKCAYSFVTIQWTIGKTKLLKDDHFSKILKNIEDKTNKKVKNQYFIFSGENNGLNGQAFWKSVDKLSNLLMIFKSKSGNIFGAFNPCQWIANCSGGYMKDDTLSSFIFSQTQDQIQIYPIKEGNKQHAFYCNQSYGPTFGSGHDINISSDFQGGSSNLGHSYSCDQYQIGNKSTHLFGQSTPNIAECEIYMLTFA